MGLASFRINQPPGTLYSYWDRARRDIEKYSVGSHMVECEAQNKSETSYLWEIIAQYPGEVITIVNSTTHTCTFAVEQSYGYLIRLTVNAGLVTEDRKTLYFGVPLASGGNLPAIGETNQDNSQAPYTGEYGHAEKTNDLFARSVSSSDWQSVEVGSYLRPSGTDVSLRVWSGTDSVPSIGFIGDLTTGIYLPSSGVLGVVCAGTVAAKFSIATGRTRLAVSKIHDDNGGLLDIYSSSSLASPAQMLIKAEGTNSTSTGGYVTILAKGYAAKAGVLDASASSAGGNVSSTFAASSLGGVGGVTALLLKSESTGVAGATLSNSTTGAVVATMTIQNQASSGSSVMGVTNTSLSASILSISSISTSSSGSSSIDITANGSAGDSSLTIVAVTTGPTKGSLLTLEANGASTVTGDAALAILTLGSVTTGDVRFKGYGISHSAWGSNGRTWIGLGTTSDFGDLWTSAGAKGSLSIASMINRSLTNGPTEIFANNHVSTSYLSISLPDTDTTHSALALSLHVNSLLPALTVSLTNTTQSFIDFKVGADSYFKMSHYSDNGMFFVTQAGTNKANNNIIITSSVNADKNHAATVSSSTSPTLYMYSATDLGTDQNQWMKITRTASYGIIQVNSVPLYVQASIMCQYTIGNSAVTQLTSAATVGINMNSGNFYYINVAHNITGWTITPPTSMVARIQVAFVGTGTYTISGFTGWNFDGAMPPFTINNGEVRIMTIYWNMSNYFAAMSGVFATA